MANKVLDGVPFGVSGGKVGLISLTFVIGSGTVNLQKLCGNDPTNVFAWVDVTDGNFSASGEITFWAPPGQQYRCQISSPDNATVYYAG